MKGNSRRAFTMIELLVVIVIGVVLMSLIFAGITTARQVADRQEGALVLRGIGQALHYYAADNDSHLPGPLWWRQPVRYDAHYAYLVTQLAPYMGGTPPMMTIFRPFTPRAWLPKLNQTPTLTIWDVNYNALSGYNQTLWGHSPSVATGNGPLKLMAIPNPNEVWTIEDIAFRDIVGFYKSTNETIWGSKRQRVFLDGHIELTPVQ